ncbi:MAG: UDP binding domain-containing protein, partial [Steroidobacteraceae bacterium]
WGLAFKPNTDDMREAPSRTIIDLLLQAGARVRAYDPVAAAEAQRIYAAHEGFLLARNAYEAAEGADALAIVTEWQEFRSPDFERLKQLLKSPLIFDGRNLYDPATVDRFGLTYHAIGRGRPVERRP